MTNEREEQVFGSMNEFYKEDAKFIGERTEQLVRGTCASAYKTGVEWADNNPSPETIRRVVALYKQWYTTESSGSIEEYVKQHWEDK